ncbi:uncharacterized protein [Amphiura filiformis]|uniref:uncharacterized protein n=1 Tax=Amphiura filiformis TaxID=82378 RepID=UPI003B221C84
MLPTSLPQADIFSHGMHNHSVELRHHVPGKIAQHGYDHFQPKHSEMPPTSQRSQTHTFNHHAKNRFTEIHSGNEYGNDTNEALQTSYSTPHHFQPKHSEMPPTSQRSQTHTFNHHAKNRLTEMLPIHSENEYQHGNDTYEALQTSLSTPPKIEQWCGYPYNESRIDLDVGSASPVAQPLAGYHDNMSRANMEASTPEAFKHDWIGQGHTPHEEVDVQKMYENSMKNAANWIIKRDNGQEDRCSDHKLDTLTHNILPHPADMKMNRKAMKHIDRTSSDMKVSKRDQKKLRYWRKPVSSETIKRGPIKPTHGRAVARRQDLHPPALHDHAWNNASPTLPNMLPPEIHTHGRNLDLSVQEESSAEQFGCSQHNAGSLMEFAKKHNVARHGNTTEGEFYSVGRPTLKYNISPGMQDNSTSRFHNERNSLDLQPQTLNIDDLEQPNIVPSSSCTDRTSFTMQESSHPMHLASIYGNGEFVGGHNQVREHLSLVSENADRSREFCLTPVQMNGNMTDGTCAVHLPEMNHDDNRFDKQYQSEIFLSETNDEIGTSCRTPMREAVGNHHTPVCIAPDAGTPLVSAVFDTPCQRQISTPLLQSTLNPMSTPSKRQIYSMYSHCNLVNYDHNSGGTHVSPVINNYMSPVPQMPNACASTSPVSLRMPEARLSTPCIIGSKSNFEVNSTVRVIHEPSPTSPHGGSFVDSHNICQENMMMPKIYASLSTDVVKPAGKSVESHFQSSNQILSDDVEQSNALQGCASHNTNDTSPTLLYKHVRDDVNDFQQETRSKCSSPLAAQNQITRDTPEPDDVFLPDTQHTLEMFSPEAGMASYSVDDKITTEPEGEEWTGVPMSNMITTPIAAKEHFDCIRSSVRQQSQDVDWNHLSTKKDRKNGGIGTHESYTSMCTLTHKCAKQDDSGSCQEKYAKIQLKPENVHIPSYQSPNQQFDFVDTPKQQVSVTKKRERKPLISQAPKDSCITPFSFSQCQTSEETSCLKDEIRSREAYQEKNASIDSKGQLECPTHRNRQQQSLSGKNNHKIAPQHSFYDSTDLDSSFNSQECTVGNVDCSQAQDVLTIASLLDSTEQNYVDSTQTTIRIGTSLSLGSITSRATCRSPIVSHEESQLGSNRTADSFSGTCRDVLGLI